MIIILPEEEVLTLKVHFFPQTNHNLRKLFKDSSLKFWTKVKTGKKERPTPGLILHPI